jgi:WD40 repeat protein
MINSFKYIFIETKSSWFTGLSYHSLSFSSDGTTIAGTKKANPKLIFDLWDYLETATGAATSSFERSSLVVSSPASEDSQFHAEDRVQFWETATGAATSSLERSSLVVFSPTDPDIAALVRSQFIHIMKRDSFGRKTWGGQTRLDCTPGTVCTFNPNGKTVMSWTSKYLQDYDLTTSRLRNSNHFVHNITSVVCCPNKPDLFVVGDVQGQLDVSMNDGKSLKSFCRLIPLDPVRVSACAWSQDGKWIATGNDDGDNFLWNARVPTSVSFAMALPRNRSNTTGTSNTITMNTSKPLATTSLVFVPDSTALIIISGGYLSVWDIMNAEYVANSGLPDMATNIALDGPRNRLAVVVNDRITIYELRVKLPEEMCQMDGKSSVSSEL